MNMTWNNYSKIERDMLNRELLHVNVLCHFVTYLEFYNMDIKFRLKA